MTKRIMMTLMLALSLAAPLAALNANAGGLIESRISGAAKATPIQLFVITGTEKGFLRIRSTRFF